eukprot:scaffold8130_cov69-Phaeocystis_antarctica.AAC.10
MYSPWLGGTQSLSSSRMASAGRSDSNQRSWTSCAATRGEFVKAGPASPVRYTASLVVDDDQSRLWRRRYVLWQLRQHRDRRRATRGLVADVEAMARTALHPPLESSRIRA